MRWRTLIQHWGVSLFFAFWAGYFIFFWGRVLEFNDAGDLVTHHIGVYGDWSTHMVMVSTFAFRTFFPSTSPFLITARFNYPFVANWIPAFFVRLGASPFPVMIFFSGLFSILIVVALFLFYRSLFRSAKMAMVSCFIFLLNGGLGFFYTVKAALHSDHRLEALLMPLERSTNLEKKQIDWASVIDSMIIPQRAFNLGFPLALLILTLVHSTRTKSSGQPTSVGGTRQKKRFLYYAAAVCLGLLPVIHPHSFFSLGIILAFWMAGDLVEGPRQFCKQGLFDWLPLCLISGALALPLMKFFLFANPLQNNFTQWYPGWYARELHINWFYFWLKNWSVTPLLAAAGLAWLIKHEVSSKSRLHWLFLFLPFFFLFAFLNLILLQPWIWDNTKLLVWASVGISGLAGYFLMKLWGLETQGLRRLSVRAVAVLLSILVTASGGLDALRLHSHTRSTWNWYSADDFTLADWVRHHTPVESVFLTSDGHNHWLDNLTGRQTIMAYNGWLWTYGLRYDSVRGDVSTMFLNPARRDLLQKYNVSYVVVGPSEMGEWHADPKKFSALYQPVFQTEKTTVYEVAGIIEGQTKAPLTLPSPRPPRRTGRGIH